MPESTDLSSCKVYSSLACGLSRHPKYPTSEAVAKNDRIVESSIAHLCLCGSHYIDISLKQEPVAVSEKLIQMNKPNEALIIW